MDKWEILEYLQKHPEHVEILRLAVEREEANAGDTGYLGWEWHEVKAYPAAIHRLVANGLVNVTYHSSKFTHYKLVDAEATKEALKDFEELTTLAEPVEEKIEIPPDLFNIIEGYEDVKKIIKAGLASAKPCHFLLVGSVSTAKSLFLEEINRIRGSSYHLGSSSTKAGLADFLFNTCPRILLIDELDKMSREDYAVLLSLMESGKVTETKYGRRREERMDVWVVGTANTLRNIPPENISRFQPYIFHFREYTPDEYARVVVRVLTEREGVDHELAKYIAERLVSLTRDVRAARGLGRLCKTKEEVDEYLEVLRKYGERTPIFGG